MLDEKDFETLEEIRKSLEIIANVARQIVPADDASKGRIDFVLAETGNCAVTIVGWTMHEKLANDQ